MHSIGKLGITKYGVGLIISKVKTNKNKTDYAYKVLFEDKMAYLDDVVFGPEVYFINKKDSKLFKKGTKLFLRKTFDNGSFLRLGNKKGSEWFSHNSFDIYCGDQRIQLMKFIDKDQSFIDRNKDLKGKETYNPQSDLIKYMLIKKEYLGPQYIFNSDLLAIKYFKYSKALEILKHIVDTEDNYLTVDGCPFCIKNNFICTKCTYKDNHKICADPQSDFQKCVTSIDLEKFMHFKFNLDVFKAITKEKYGW